MIMPGGGSGTSRRGSMAMAAAASRDGSRRASMLTAAELAAAIDRGKLDLGRGKSQSPPRSPSDANNSRRGSVDGWAGTPPQIGEAGTLEGVSEGDDALKSLKAPPKPKRGGGGAGSISGTVSHNRRGGGGGGAGGAGAGALGVGGGGRGGGGGVPRAKKGGGASAEPPEGAFISNAMTKSLSTPHIRRFGVAGGYGIIKPGARRRRAGRRRTRRTSAPLWSIAACRPTSWRRRRRRPQTWRWQRRRPPPRTR